MTSTQPPANAARTPGSTYRLQFHADFTLRDALAIVPYLRALGVTHLYASPILKARPGSTHGYDVIDHAVLNPEVGTEDDLAALGAALRERGMGLLLDAVPNHMCVAAGNAWWADLLEHGQASRFAGHFDIAWDDSPRPQMHGRLLLPVLGDQYGAVLESGQFAPAFENGGFVVRVHDNHLPLDPRTYDRVLAPAAALVREQCGAEHPSAIQLASVLHAVKNLPARTEADPARIAERRVEVVAIRRRLSELAERFPEAADAVKTVLVALAGKAGDPASFAALDELLEAQAYRPCFWRVASDEINYRRFFDVNDLAALSTEHAEVFDAVHATWFRWVRSGLADGLRIDHPDGLFDPKEYLDRLQSACGGEEPLYVVVEKILGDGETLPTDWACAGTTGYEFIHAINGLFVDRAGEGPLTAFYQQFTGLDDPWAEMVYRGKRQVSQSSLASELNALAHQLDRVARLDRRSRDFTLNGIRKALREVIACFPVYRSYVTDAVTDTDKAVVGKATRWAYRRNPLLGKAVFDFIRDTVLLKDSPSGPASSEYRALQRSFAGKFQQVTSPVAAKGVEDTAFYVYNRLTSLNEVGGEPGRFGWKPDAVHTFLAARAPAPGGLSPLSTHDTKRGEDVRARISVLSEIPNEWAERVTHWSELNRAHKIDVDGALAPDANEEYLLYQTLVGAWPGSEEGASDSFRQRIREYMRKGLAEAKVHTSWINPNPEYETAIATFIDRVLDTDSSGAFLRDLGAFAARVAGFGRINSLAQTLIRCTAPGVPDTYQGTESWDFSLVDPDNRRPVDYDARAEWLRDVDARITTNSALNRLARELAENLADPRAKLFVTALALRSRREWPDVFARGEYVPLAVTGEHADRVFAFLRTAGGRAAAAIVPRLPTGQSSWGDTALSFPEAFAGVRWENVFTGEVVEPRAGSLPVGAALGAFPVALLRSV
ncbi:malto-oligosyltrehalose synthase [Gemmata sp. G18]|uniref:Malto-oligosyltrehalose synthase n=1 Tax=Gemmata palustris TaxID=2822762 RepID=A0ABS5BJU3_9BACT|nr:malto-oligosyltrehalose synthase [Gemmata palustris]MBP3953974.1 malto-oligosyltrehalose synthase [Gemmata palustris]